MKSLPKYLLAATVLASAGFAAVAQTAAPAVVAPAGPRAEMQAHRGGHRDDAQWQQRRQERRAQRLQQLKQTLQITPAQEGAWTTWVAAMQPQQRAQRPDRAAFRSMSTPQRIDAVRALRTQRAAEMDRRGEATKAFYAALTPEQKKTFDDRGARIGRGGFGGKHGHRRG